jgi:hypothetical protein
MVLAGALPLAIKPQATRVAVIGLGSGLTTHTLLASPRIAELDTIEIEPAMVEGARLFDPLNRRAYADPRSHVHIEDAKTFFAAQREPYDIIVSEPSNPWVSGVSTLFSEEFYGRVKQHLRPDGLLVQWVHSYEISTGLVASIFLALGKHFPDYAIYGGGVGDLFVVASPSGRVPPISPEIFSMPGAAADLARLGFRGVGDLLALRVGGRAAIEPLFVQTGFPANSDFFPVLDQRAPRSRFKNESAEGLRGLRDAFVPVLPLLDGESRTPLARLRATSLNDPVRVGRAAQGAEAIGVFLSGAAASAPHATPEARRSALIARAYLDNCSGSEEQWVGAIADLARGASPYLERDDVAIVFERALASRCWRTLGEATRARVLLMQAINDRDPRAMARHAESLLEAGAPAPEDERTLYVMAAMTAHLAMGQKARALAIAGRYLGSISPGERDLLAVRLLAAHAGREPASSRP